MATLKRCHAPVPWGARVDKVVWERSRSGTPRRRRSDRPPLKHDSGWDWDGRRIFPGGKAVVPDGEEQECEIYAFQREDEDENPLILPGRVHATVSLLGIARYQATKRRNKAKNGLNDFEVIRVPKVVPILEEQPDVGDSWELDEWEKLDAWCFKRTYSEVARSFVDLQGPPSTPGCPRLAPCSTEDDPWECL